MDHPGVDADTPTSGAQNLTRRSAATRVAGPIRVVCVTDWSTPVHQLSGATRLVWEALQTPQRPDQVATTLGVDADDPFLVQALDLLVDAGLVDRSPT